MLTPIQLGLASHLSAVTLLFSAFLIPPSRLSHTKLALAFLPPIWACHTYSWSVGLGFLAAVQVLWATELLLFQNPREKFHVIHHSPPPPSSKTEGGKDEAGSRSNEESEKDDKKMQSWKEPYPLDSILKRASWVFKLLISLRYVGWDIGSPTSIPSTPVSSLPRRKESRIHWLLKNIFLAGLSFLAIDATNAYQHMDPYFQVETSIDSPFPQRLASSLASWGLAFLSPRMVRIVISGVQQYAVFTMINRVFAIVHVLLGGLGILDGWWGGVENWPMLMGSPAVVWRSGLKGFWGRGWHQLFRYVFTSPGNTLVKLVGIEPKTTLAYAVKIAVAFLLSGALHAASLPLNVPGLSPLRYASFFWMHGLYVLLEVFVERVLQGDKRSKPRQSWIRWGMSGVRLVWVVGVLYLTGPLIVDELTRLSRVMGLRPTVLFTIPK